MQTEYILLVPKKKNTHTHTQAKVTLKSHEPTNQGNRLCGHGYR